MDFERGLVNLWLALGVYSEPFNESLVIAGEVLLPLLLRIRRGVEECCCNVAVCNWCLRGYVFSMVP